MLVSQETITAYLCEIPPSPDIIRRAITLLDQQNIPQAAMECEKDPALTRFFQNVISKPIFAQKEAIKDMGRIFSTLGTRSAKALLNSYLTSLLITRPWALFPITNELYFELSSQTIVYWDQLLNAYAPEKAIRVASAAPLLCASVIVADALFANVKSDIDLIRQSRFMDYGHILQKMAGMDLIELAVFIAKKWEIDSEAIYILECMAHPNRTDNSNENLLARHLHLLFFYLLSKPEYMGAGLNDLIEFDPEFVEPIYEDFAKVMNL